MITRKQASTRQNVVGAKSHSTAADKVQLLFQRFMTNCFRLKMFWPFKTESLDNEINKEICENV